MGMFKKVTSQSPVEFIDPARATSAHLADQTAQQAQMMEMQRVVARAQFEAAAPGAEIPEVLLSAEERAERSVAVPARLERFAQKVAEEGTQDKTFFQHKTVGEALAARRLRKADR